MEITTQNFIGTVRKIGNSLTLTIPHEIVDSANLYEGNSVEVGLRKISEEELKNKDLLRKHKFFGKGEILLDKKFVGRIERVYLNLYPGTISETSSIGVNGEFPKSKEIYFAKGYIFGEFTDKEFLDTYLRNSGSPLFLDLGLRVLASDKSDDRFQIYIKDFYYHASSSRTKLNEEFMAKVEKKDLKRL